MNPIFMMCNDVPWCYFPETPGRTPSIQSKNTRLRSLAGKHAPSSKWLQQVFNRSVPRQNDVPQKQQRIKWVKWKGGTKIHLELMNWKYSMALHFQNLNVCNNIGSLYAPRRMQYNAECWECLQLPGMSPRSFWGDDSSKNTSTNTTLTTLIQCNPKCFTKCIKIQQTLSLHATGCGTSVALRCSTTWFRSWSWLCPWEMVWNVYMVHEKKHL